MIFERLCEAAAMDAAVFGNWEASAAWVPPCDEPGTEAVGDYWLCEGCADALRFFGNLAHRTKEARQRAARAIRLYRFALDVLKLLAIMCAVPIVFVFIILLRRLFP